MRFWKKTASILSVGANSFLVGCGFLENSFVDRPKLSIAWSNLRCAVSLNTALGDARWEVQEMPWSRLARFSPCFHVNSVGVEMVPLELAQNFASLSSASARFFFIALISNMIVHI